MLGGFQDYLINLGWKRYKCLMDSPIYNNGIFEGWPKEYNYDSNYVSTYSPMEYMFENDNRPDIKLWWGLYERHKPPIFGLSRINIVYEGKIEYFSWNLKTPGYVYAIPSQQDIWHKVFEQHPFDIIYQAILEKKTLIVKE